MFFTAHTDKTTVARAQGIQPAGHLVKPFNRDRLRDTIHKALGIEEEELAKPKGKASILLIDDCDAKHASINRRWSFPNSSRREMFNR